MRLTSCRLSRRMRCLVLRTACTDWNRRFTTSDRLSRCYALPAGATRIRPLRGQLPKRVKVTWRGAHSTFALLRAERSVVCRLVVHVKPLPTGRREEGPFDRESASHLCRTAEHEPFDSGLGVLSRTATKTQKLRSLSGDGVRIHASRMHVYTRLELTGRRLVLGHLLLVTLQYRILRYTRGSSRPRPYGYGVQTPKI